jgi:ABC-type Fe3+/spermidine/putrescine transport system ATPase subunit
VVLAERIALLFDGRLAQWGAARTLFERPQSVRVARFFGGVNFLPGTRVGSHVRTPLGEFHAPGGDARGSVTLTIRPEHVRVRDMSAQDRPNHFAAELVESLYRGTDTRLRLRSGAHAVEVLAPAAQADSLHPGDRVALHFPPDSIWTLNEND